MSNQPEDTFVRLCYSLGGDRPSQTTRLAMSLRLQNGRLDNQCIKGGISTTAPRILAYTLHSLPPILHIMHQISLPRYSKGPRGLSVLLRVNGIFTATAISLSLQPRQRPDRYTIRAGRNLPDKEFRYLRTVIVTAAVYWGFSSELRLAANPSP